MKLRRLPHGGIQLPGAAVISQRNSLNRKSPTASTSRLRLLTSTSLPSQHTHLRLTEPKPSTPMSHALMRPDRLTSRRSCSSVQQCGLCATLFWDRLQAICRRRMRRPERSGMRTLRGSRYSSRWNVNATVLPQVLLQLLSMMHSCDSSRLPIPTDLLPALPQCRTSLVSATDSRQLCLPGAGNSSRSPQ